MDPRLPWIQATASKSEPSSFKLGNSELFFVGPTLLAVDYNGQIAVRSDISIGPRARRRLNQWRGFDKQQPLDFYSFLVVLQDALLYGMKEVRDEIFAGA